MRRWSASRVFATTTGLAVGLAVFLGVFLPASPGVVSGAGFGLRAAHATRWVSAYDPAVQVKPPTMRAWDGSARALVIDGDFAARAAAYRQAHPKLLRAEGAVVRSGEVVIVEGSDETLDTTETGSAVRIQAIARKVIEQFGDHFHAMTLWLTFNDLASPQAEAYEFTVKADVRGLGMNIRDNAAGMGSGGTLRSILNMKRVWSRVQQPTLEAWRPALEVWGQESGHRWMVFMQFIDRRTGLPSDALLGRDCSHYHRLVDTQGSVHDGSAWTDNGNGTFTLERNPNLRYGNLDLYGMGLLPADEMPAFFFIDGVANYTRPGCASYETRPPPGARMLTGTRVDVSVDDVIAFEGPRAPSADEPLAGERQDYFREVEVIVTRPTESANDPLPQMIAARINQARLLWETWMTEATGRRMVVCTQVSADCGDPRSDVAGVIVNPDRTAPGAAPTKVEVQVSNPGSVPATGIEARLEFGGSLTGEKLNAVEPVGTLAAGESRTVTFALDLRKQTCGDQLPIKISTQSDRHHHRARQTMSVGTESVLSEDFEKDASWQIDPDKTDTATGAVWERGTPERTEILSNTLVQAAGAHGGSAAFVTGAAASVPGKETFLHGGRSTLQSPLYDAGAWRDPQLHYWVTFAGMAASAAGEIGPSAQSRLLVQARVMGGPADAGARAGAAAAAADPAGWLEVDRLENQIKPVWSERFVKLPPALVGAKLQLRFVAEDANPAAGGVEAALDDVEIVSNLPACYVATPAGGDGGGGGGGCTAGGAPVSSARLPWLLLGVWGAVIARRRRRRVG